MSASSIRVKVALYSPLLADPEWIARFKVVTQGYRDAAEEVLRNQQLPGHPLWLSAQKLRFAYAMFADHLLKVVADNTKRMEKDGVVTVVIGENINQAYQWACGIAEESKLNVKPPAINKRLPAFDHASVTTHAELKSLERILELLSQGQAPSPTPMPEAVATLASGKAATPLPDERPCAAVLVPDKQGEDQGLPNDTEFKMFWAAEQGARQKGIAETLNISQASVSRGIARVKKWLAAGNKLPGFDEVSARRPRVFSVDPHKMELFTEDDTAGLEDDE
jgi:hypothetical protein